MVGGAGSTGGRWRAYVLVGALCMAMVQITVAVQRATHSRTLTLIAVAVSTLAGIVVTHIADRRGWLGRR